MTATQRRATMQHVRDHLRIALEHVRKLHNSVDAELGHLSRGQMNTDLAEHLMGCDEQLGNTKEAIQSALQIADIQF